MSRSSTLISHVKSPEIQYSKADPRGIHSLLAPGSLILDDHEINKTFHPKLIQILLKLPNKYKYFYL